MVKLDTTIYVAGDKVFLPTNNQVLYGEKDGIEDWRQMWSIVQGRDMLNEQFSLKQIQELNPTPIYLAEIEILAHTIETTRMRDMGLPQDSEIG